MFTKIRRKKSIFLVARPLRPPPLELSGHSYFFLARPLPQPLLVAGPLKKDFFGAFPFISNFSLALMSRLIKSKLLSSPEEAVDC